MSDTHYRAPQGLDVRFNAIVRWFADRGVNLAGAQTLTVLGRKTGTPQRIPVNPLTIDGAQYLVSVRGQTQWVRNVRVNGAVELRRGRRTRAAHLTEVPDSARPAIIRRYLDKWGWEVGRFLPDGVGVDATTAQIRAHAHQIPVFVVG
ncbi:MULTISPECIES: nitroreductase family deazaflavin-dependent oxidoreductase [unclassified Gordonia (in: high G+C Gram-positive bacteria)]|jgi:deazaflavin-dependent oxidoreductase (nitroreductase family)